MSQQHKSNSGGLGALAYASSIVGGGVVGHDYARWFDVSPAVGALVGIVVGAIVTSILLHIVRDPENKIQDGICGICTLLGILLGVVVGLNGPGGAGGFFGGALVGGFFGFIAGKLIFFGLVLASFSLLFISRGPVGFMIRNAITGSDDPESVQANAAGLTEAMSSLLDPAPALDAIDHANALASLEA